jgi:hypothetical protein
MVTRALGWQPGNPLSIRVTDSLIIVMAADDGQLAVSSQGHVHLPAAARHASGNDQLFSRQFDDQGVLLLKRGRTRGYGIRTKRSWQPDLTWHFPWFESANCA